MKRIVFMVTVALVVALILVGGAASAQEPEAVSVQVDSTAQAIAGGRTLLVTVEVVKLGGDRGGGM
jgi:outer membrane murein-binding lipoprotein Lpp